MQAPVAGLLGALQKRGGYRPMGIEGEMQVAQVPNVKALGIGHYS